MRNRVRGGRWFPGAPCRPWKYHDEPTIDRTVSMPARLIGRLEKQARRRQKHRRSPSVSEEIVEAALLGLEQPDVQELKRTAEATEKEIHRIARENRETAVALEEALRILNKGGRRLTKRDVMRRAKLRLDRERLQQQKRDQPPRITPHQPAEPETSPAA